MKKNRLIVDAGAIAEPNRSGVGHTAHRLVLGLANDHKFTSMYDIVLVVAFNKVNLIDKELRDKVRVRRVFIPGRFMNALVRYRLLPPMDVFFGRGVYLFPNFKNWPLVWSKSITYIHDVYFRVNREHIEPRNLSFLERHVETFIRRADEIVTVSHHAKTEIEHFFPQARGNVSVVYNGIDKKEFYPRSLDEQRAVAEKYLIAPGEYFMYLSNFEPRKNVGTLLDAYKYYSDRNSDKKQLVLVGGMGWNNEAIVRKIQDMQKKGYGVVKPTKYVPDEDIPALLSGAVALVHPAYYEGFGLSPLQAIACDTPVIVGNNSSIPEVVGSNYRGYVDITDARSIASKMEEAAKGKTKIDVSMKKQADRFTWRKSTDDLVKVIASLEYNR